MEEQGLGCTLLDSETKADDQLFYILWPGYGGWGAVVGAMFSTIAEGENMVFAVNRRGWELVFVM